MNEDDKDEIKLEDRENVAFNPDGTVTLTLEHPVEWGSDNTITELRFRRATAKDARLVKGKNRFEESASLIARLTNQEPPVIDALDFADFIVANEIVGFFSKSSRQTGRNGSGSSRAS